MVKACTGPALMIGLAGPWEAPWPLKMENTGHGQSIPLAEHHILEKSRRWSDLLAKQAAI